VRVRVPRCPRNSWRGGRSVRPWRPPRREPLPSTRRLRSLSGVVTRTIQSFSGCCP